MPQPTIDSENRHLWQITAARDLIILALIASLLWFLYLLRDIFIPLLLALVLAHVFNPLITWFERKWQRPRPLTIALLLAIVVSGCSALFAWVGPLLVAQMTDLVQRLPDYLRTLASNYGIDLSELETAVRQYGGDLQQILGRIFQTTGRALGFVSAVFGIASYLILSVALVLVYFFFFAWGFNSATHRLKKYLPQSRRDRIIEIAGKNGPSRRSLLPRQARHSLYHGWVALNRLVLDRRALLVLFGHGHRPSQHGSVSLGSDVAFRSLAQVFGSHQQQRRLYQLCIDRRVAHCSVRRGAVVGRLVLNAVDSERPNQSECGNRPDRRDYRTSVGRIWGLLFAIPIAACIKILANELVLPPLRSWAAKH
jgi:AI-2E family transporter